MSYFDENKLERIRWRCSLNLEKFFKDPLRGFYYGNCEYVAIWYKNRLSIESSITRVEVTFINLTNPTYKDKKSKKTCQSFFVVALPINYLHKIPFGSIWKTGESEEKFKLEEYKITFSKSKGLSYQSLWQNKNSHPFEADKYVHPSNLERFKEDGNKLLVIKQDNYFYIIHPLHFFMAHYGYSSELKRILVTDNWSKIEKKLHLNEYFNENGVFLPTNLSTNDAVFLHHLKYDKYTNTVIKDVNANILLSKHNGYPNYLIPCWHDQSITLSFYGISLGNSVLCCQITGISQPKGNAINLYYYSATKANLDGKALENDKTQYRKRKQERDHELEKLDMSLNNVNNLVTADVIEYLKLLGEKREVNRIGLTHETARNSNFKFFNHDEPTNFSIGEKQGKRGNTGFSDCFYDIPNNQEIEGKTRIDTIWEHAKRLRYEQNCKVYWYTPKKGYNENDELTLISLKDICDSLHKSYPICSLILRIDVKQRTFFALNFPTRERRSDSGFSSIVYETLDIQKFLSININNSEDTIFKLLIEIISAEGVSSDYVDSKNGQMSMFRHVEAKKTKNNWVWNGIKKLL